MNLMHKLIVTTLVVLTVGSGWLLGYKEWTLTGQVFAAGVLVAGITLVGAVAMLWVWVDTE